MSWAAVITEAWDSVIGWPNFAMSFCNTSDDISVAYILVYASEISSINGSSLVNLRNDIPLLMSSALTSGKKIIPKLGII